MKIEQQDKPKFEPITLTIENKEELQLFLSFIGSVSANKIEEITGVRMCMLEPYDMLVNIAKERGMNTVKFLSIKVVQGDNPL